MYCLQTLAEGISVQKLNGEVKIVQMGHCTAAANTTDMHSQNRSQI